MQPKPGIQALCPEFAALQLHHAPGDSQSETKAIPTRPRCIQASNGSKDHLQLIWRHSRSFIFDLEVPVLPFQTSRKAHAPLTRRVTDRVA